MRLARVVGAVAVVVCALTSCGSGGESESKPTAASSTVDSTVQAVPTPNPCASLPEQCSGKEVTATHCDRDAFDAYAIESLRVGPVSGKLTIRKANPSQCLRTYWGHFRPDSQNQASFKVTTRILKEDGTLIAEADQASEPKNPGVDAWTEGLYADENLRVEVSLHVQEYPDYTLAIYSV